MQKQKLQSNQKQTKAGLDLWSIRASVLLSSTFQFADLWQASCVGYLWKKAYGIVVYESISDEAKLEAYVELAPKAFDKYGAKFLTRGYPSVLKENARNERTVVVEFPSVEQAEAFYESDEYQLALEALGDGAVRTYKICEAF